MSPSIDQVLDFWFVQAGPPQWFNGGADFDQQVEQVLGDAYAAAAQGALTSWEGGADGLLALCILLDQVPRNIFRGTSRAFATDAKALELARRAVDGGHDMLVPAERRAFFYLPFEHAENMEDQRRAVRLFAGRTENPEYLDYACKHLVVIAEFGRFPHRNAILGRENSPAEREYLARPGAGF